MLRHEPECDTAAHIDHQDGSDPGPCLSSTIGEGPTSAWLRWGPTGAMVVLDTPPLTRLSLGEFASLCSKGIELVSRVGAVPPTPRRSPQT